MNAPEKATEIKAAVVTFIAFLTALWGWLGWTVIIWLGCILLDYIAGTLAAKKAGEWSSDIAREGLWHKLGEIFAALVAALCDIALQVIVEGAGVTIPISIGPLLTPIVLLWYIVTELGSIIENCGKLGAPVPSWLRKSLKQYKDTLDRERGEEPQGTVTGEPVTGTDEELDVPAYIRDLWENALNKDEPDRVEAPPDKPETEEQ